MYAKHTHKEAAQRPAKIACITRLESGLLKGDLITEYTENAPEVKCLFNASGGRVTESDAWKLKGE